MVCHQDLLKLVIQSLKYIEWLAIGHFSTFKKINDGKRAFRIFYLNVRIGSMLISIDL
jgi:hypothetical protein